MNSALDARRPRPPQTAAVSTRRLKEFVLSRFAENDPLRQVILAERDSLTVAEFLAKLETWLVLLNGRA